MPVTPDLAWSGLPDTLTGGVEELGTRNGENPRAIPVVGVARALNHVGAHGRTIFTQHIVPGDSPSVAVSTPLYRLRYFQRNENGRALIYRAIFLPKDPAVSAPPGVLQDDTSAVDVITTDAREAAGSITTPGDLIAMEGSVPVAVPSGAESSRLIDVIDGFRLISLSIVEAPAAAPPYTLDTGQHFVPQPGGLASGQNIATTRLVDLRETTEELWTRVRSVYNHSAHGFTGTDGFAITDTTTFTNLIDGTTARTTATAGIPVSALSGGKGFGTYVTAHVAVYAERTAGVGTGEVRFTSSLNSLDITGIGALGWYAGASNTLQIATGTNIDGIGRDWEKVDVLFRVSGAGNTLRVWAVHLEIEP